MIIRNNFNIFIELECTYIYKIQIKVQNLKIKNKEQTKLLMALH